MSRKFAIPIIGSILVQSIAYGAPMNRPEIKLNPHARMRYDITVRIDNAPGPFDRVEGIVDYRVSNEACVPITPITGATISPEKRVTIKLKPAGEGLYKGEVYADLLQDEDYFGKGECHWALVAAGADLFVKDVAFSASLFRDDFFNSGLSTRFYSDRSYATTYVKRIDVGAEHREQFETEAKATFSVTIEAKEPHP